jgi:iron complex outermembrane receptor protein
VLKGPQGTLFGRNTIGGAVQLFTREPTQQFEGLAQATFGNYSDREFAAVVNLPVSDTFAIRMTARQFDREGTGKNLSNGVDLGDKHGHAFKIGAKWTPTDNLTVLLRADEERYVDNQSALKPFAMVAGSTANREVATETGLSLEAARALYLSYASGSFYDATTDRQPWDKSELSGGSATITWETSPNFTIKSISAQRRFIFVAQQDLDASPFQIISQVPITRKANQLSQELQFIGSLMDNRLTYIAGGFYSHENTTDITRQVSTARLSTTNPANNGGFATNRSASVFGQAAFKFAEAWSLSVGGRYTEDHRRFQALNQNTITCLALGRPLAAGPCLYDGKAKFDNFSYLVSLDYKPTDSLYLYAKVSTAYRSGGIPIGGGSALSAAAAATSFTPFKPETATAYEAGVKSQWLQDRLRANMAVYHTKYSNVQVSSPFTVPGTSLIVTGITNAASGLVDGAEIDLEAIPVHGLELRASAAYTDPRYKNYVIGGVDLSSTPFRFVPKWAYSLSAAYTQDVAFGSLRYQADYDWSSRIYTSNFVGRPSLGLLGGRVSAHLDESDVDIALFGKNLTQKKYFAYVVDTGALGIQAGFAGSPRTYGVELTKHF